MFKAKQTRCRMIKHVCNEKCVNWYYVTYCHVTNEEKKVRYKLHWLTLVDCEDVWEWLGDEVENPTDKEWKEARENLVGELNYNVLYDIECCKNIDELQRIVDWMNETIKKY